MATNVSQLNTPAQTEAATKPNWQSAGFINCAIRMDNGTLVHLEGSLNLKLAKTNHPVILELLKSDTDGTKLKKLMETRAEFTFRENIKAEPSTLEL